MHLLSSSHVWTSVCIVLCLVCVWRCCWTQLHEGPDHPVSRSPDNSALRERTPRLLEMTFDPIEDVCSALSHSEWLKPQLTHRSSHTQTPTRIHAHTHRDYISPHGIRHPQSHGKIHILSNHMRSTNHHHHLLLHHLHLANSSQTSMFWPTESRAKEFSVMTLMVGIMHILDTHTDTRTPHTKDNAFIDRPAGENQALNDHRATGLFMCCCQSNATSVSVLWGH